MLRRRSDGWDVIPPRRADSASTVLRIADELPPVLLAVRYIGPRRGRRLLAALGADWRRLVDLAPERVFGTLRGVGPRQARIAAESWLALSRNAPGVGREPMSSEHPMRP
jgi:hypothetical protein